MMVVMQTEAGPGPRAIRGIFRATSTRDGEAIFRDGQPYVDINPLGQDVTGRALFEIQFTDGKWMLAVDLEFGANTPEQAGTRLQREGQRWKQVIERLGLKID